MSRPRGALHCLLALLLAAVGGCASNGRKATDQEIAVARGPMTVASRSQWSSVRGGKQQSRWEEVWTWNGPQLDRVTLIGGLPQGKAIQFQKMNADQQVPVFRAGMTAQDLASMIEVSYRVNGVTMFNVESVEPADFLGGPGIRMRYHYASGIGFLKRGHCVMRIVDDKLYAMKLESVSSHFDAVRPVFDQLVSSARLRQPE